MNEVLIHCGECQILFCEDGEAGLFYPVETSDVYDGSYVVIPSNREQMLETANKLMSKDVTVKEIPYYETSNESGTTVYIGGNV